MEKLRKSFGLMVSNFKNKTFLKIFLYASLPLAMLFVVIFTQNILYERNTRELLIESNISMLKSAFNESDYKIKSILEQIDRFIEDELFIQAFLQTGEPDSFSYKDTAHIIGLFKTFVQKYNFVESVVLLNRSGQTVLYDGGQMQMRQYLDEAYRYQDYDYSFWQSYSNESRMYRILPPTSVTIWKADKYVIPIVFTSIGDVDTSNIFIMNINIQVVYDCIKQTDNDTLVFIVNNKTRQCFAQKDTEINIPVGDEFFEKIMSHEFNAFKYKTNQNKPVLVVSYSPMESMFDFRYIASIPYSHIARNRALSVLLLFVCVFYCIIVTLTYSTKKIYAPIAELANLFDYSNIKSFYKNGFDAIKYIHQSISEALQSNDSLNHNLYMMMPLVHEKYLLNILNSNENYHEQEVSDYLSQNGFVFFNREYFLSIIVHLKLSKTFYDDFNSQQHQLIYNGIYNIVQAAFNSDYDAYVLTSEKDTMYILLNMDNDREIEKIQATIHWLNQLFEADKDFVRLEIGIGRIYKGLEGLKQSHTEAKNALMLVNGLNGMNIKMYEPTAAADAYVLTTEEENHLFNYLVGGFGEEAKSLIVGITEQNANTSKTAIDKVYVQLLNIVLKAMKLKNIPYDNEEVENFSLNMQLKPVSENLEFILLHIDHISNYTQKYNKNIDIQEVVNYIGEHCREDIYLDILAEKFNTNARHLSRLIKNYTGVNFVDLLASNRVSLVKALLTTTNKSMSAIAKESGFNSKTTFIRTFKKVTGLTPSEYKSIYS